MTMQLKLRPYQAEGLRQLFAWIEARKGVPILSFPTGAGKTVLTIYLMLKAMKQKLRAIFVVDRLPLITQTSEEFDNYGIPHGIIQADNERTRPWEGIQIAMAQTLAERVKRGQGWPEADLIIIDECHTVLGVVANRIREAKKQCAEGRKIIVVGLTATPMTKGLGNVYDGVISPTTTNRLTDEGWLVPYRIFARSEPDMTGAEERGGEWTHKAAGERSMQIIGDCVAEYMRYGQGKKFIAFAADVKNCEEMQRRFMDAGIVTDLFTYRTTEAERKALVKEFKSTESKVRGLISVSALAKGFDVKDVEVIIMARPLKKSLSEHIQILGRGLRSFPGKTECIVLDHSGNCFRFWDAMHDFFESGTTELDGGARTAKAKAPPKERKPMKCPTCAQIHDPLPACPTCGHIYARARVIEHVAGTLHEVKGKSKKVEPTVEAKRIFHAELRGYAAETGKSKGWVLAKFQEKHHEWPPRNELPPREPTSQTRNWIKSRNMAWAKSKAKAARA